MTQGKENTPHIGIFGRVNAGKSTLLNFITGVRTAITSPVGGTTTDPVRKSYEITGFSPVVLIDTAGVDEKPTPDLAGSTLARQRAGRTGEAARAVDLAIIVFTEWTAEEERLKADFQKRGIPYILLHNVWKGAGGATAAALRAHESPVPDISMDIDASLTADHTALIELIKSRLPERSRRASEMFGRLLAADDHVVLVCPIDAGAPAGRMILPQMQALREVLDSHAAAHVVQPDELSTLLDSLSAGGVTPRMVVTDSQVYGRVRAGVPSGIEVTTFSILLAAAKGDYGLYSEGLERVREMKDGDRILVCEFCSHQVSCDDIARVKIPAMMRSFTGRELDFTYVGPTEPLPPDIGSYALMLLCGGCMATRAQVQGRIAQAREAGIAATNFGMLLRLLQSKNAL